MKPEKRRETLGNAGKRQYPHKTSRMVDWLVDLRLDYQGVPLRTRFRRLVWGIVLGVALVGWVVVSGYWTGALP